MFCDIVTISDHVYANCDRNLPKVISKRRTTNLELQTYFHCTVFFKTIQFVINNYKMDYINSKDNLYDKQSVNSFEIKIKKHYNSGLHVLLFTIIVY